MNKNPCTILTIIIRILRNNLYLINILIIWVQSLTKNVKYSLIFLVHSLPIS